MLIHGDALELKQAISVLSASQGLQKEGKMEVFQKHVFVCTTGKICPNQGSVEVCDALRKEISERGLKKQIRINKSGCFDQCGNGPLIVVYPESTWYAHVDVYKRQP